MTLKIKSFLVFILTSFSFSAIANSIQDQKLEKVADQFQQQFHQYLEYENVPGAAFAIVSKDGFVRIGTFGYTDLSKKRAIDENTIFRIASLSKTFAATLTGIMVQEGLLSWDDFVVKYSRVLGRAGQKSNIKIKHLLGQSSGFQPYAYDLQVEDGLPLRTILRNISRLPLRCRPGKCYAYQNSVFSAIEPILKSISGKSYEELLQEKIFDPLNMLDASASYAKLKVNPNRAKPHEWKDGKPDQVRNKPHYYRIKPAAGINASISDMAQYLKAHVGSMPDVLHSQTLDIISKPRVETKKDLKRINWRDYVTDAHYAIGWRNYSFMGNELIYHGGWVSGYRSDIAYSKKHGVGIVVMLNIEGRHTSYLTTQFFKRLFQTL
ncbi:MAG: beta-lactamase family protein [Kangiellaceae bacterium]|nr:beta-lactamase family protein [Kangiellaceae bacterium]